VILILLLLSIFSASFLVDPSRLASIVIRFLPLSQRIYTPNLVRSLGYCT
jgi:hypothetical protein